MAGMTDAAANAILDAMVGTTFPAPFKLSLHTADPGAAGTAAEVSGGSYARQAVTFAAAASRAKANSAVVTFSGMPSCTVTYVGVWDATATPVFRWAGALTASKVVNVGDPFEFPVGDFSLALS